MTVNGEIERLLLVATASIHCIFPTGKTLASPFLAVATVGGEHDPDHAKLSVTRLTFALRMVRALFLPQNYC